MLLCDYHDLRKKTNQGDGGEEREKTRGGGLCCKLSRRAALRCRQRCEERDD
ncbi:hypothetical protein A2U01_0094632, partial [Trifolium medium]|nr:hypothetical protein [Trifolium medium]